MLRHRDIAASPVRTAATTWDTITDLVVETLDRSPAIEGEAVRGAFEGIKGAGVALVAAGYLDKMHLTVVASPLYLTVGTISGEGAFTASEEENLNAVTGAASADSWMVYLPRPAGLASLIDEIVDGVDRVSTDEPPKDHDGDHQVSLAVNLARLDPKSRS